MESLKIKQIQCTTIIAYFKSDYFDNGNDDIAKEIVNI